jgi:DNA-binding MarR family transcriptional regulator
MTDDVTERSRWRPLRLLMQQIDEDIAQVYAETPGADRVRPAWVFELLRLDARGPMTIRALADSVGRTHSALSQKVAAMQEAGLVRLTAGPDARSRHVVLTEDGQALVEGMRREWEATEATLAEIEAETEYPLSRAVSDLQAVLARKGFYQRLRERLDAGRPR